MKCRECKYIEARGANEYCTYHDAYVGWHGCEYGEPKPQTNADRIRSMSDEELAELMEDKGDCPPIECPHDGKGAKITRLDCKACWLDWLKAPVEEAQDGT